MDISDRKSKESQIQSLLSELEFRVVERTAQLTAANEELAAFSYSVSHDLRSPLRSIHGFSQVIREDCGDRLDASGLDALNRIQNAAVRMDDLINGLLHLARMTQAKMHKSKVDLSQLAHDVERELRSFNDQRSIEFRVEDGLVCEADPSLIRAVLDNLLSNAWKFTSTSGTAIIEFGKYSENTAECVFFVKYNGVGFEMHHASKLFSPFERLHSTDRYPGSGIGLATVQRIISRHGGRIWAESEPEKGSTFYFSIPKVPKAVSVR
jgi:light-regulated signal transduction histidine kinase (bacteriophytochrome)